MDETQNKQINELEKLVGMVSTLKENEFKEIDLKNRASESEQKRLERETNRKGLEEYYQLRKDWSKYLVRFLSLMILFQFAVTIGVGRGWLNFETSNKLLYIVVGENFLQIIGMCLVVVKFLFPGDKRS